jgi:hypothetical protein
VFGIRRPSYLAGSLVVAEPRWLAQAVAAIPSFVALERSADGQHRQAPQRPLARPVPGTPRRSAASPPLRPQGRRRALPRPHPEPAPRRLLHRPQRRPDDSRRVRRRLAGEPVAPAHHGHAGRRPPPQSRASLLRRPPHRKHPPERTAGVGAQPHGGPGAGDRGGRLPHPRRHPQHRRRRPPDRPHPGFWHPTPPSVTP